jgi:hypothetical protein
MLPLVAALERSQATVREQAETIGELRAENRALLARTGAEAPEPTPESSPPIWRLWWLWLALLVVAGLAVLGAWPR